MHRLGNFRTLSPNWDVFIKHFPAGLRDLCGRGSRKIVRTKRDGWPQEDNALQAQQD